MNLSWTDVIWAEISNQIVFPTINSNLFIYELYDIGVIQ